MKRAFLIILVFNVFRIILISYIGVLPHETVYLADPNANLFIDSNAPTLVHWITGFIIFLFGHSLFTIRMVFFFLSLFTQWSLYLLVLKIIRPNRKYLSWAIITSTIPFTLISITSLPDSLLTLFWILALLTLYNAIFERHKLSWALSGIFMGLAILNKLSGIALPVGMLLFLIFSLRYRDYLFTAAPYITLFFTGLLSLPLLVGVLSTNNPSMQIALIERIFDFLQISVKDYSSFIGFQLILILPVLYLGLWWVTLKYFGRIFKKPNQVNPEFWFLLSFFLPLFLGFHLISFFSWVDFLGLIPAYFTGMIVLLKLIKTRWMYWSLGLTIAAHLLLILVPIFWP